MKIVTKKHMNLKTNIPILLFCLMTLSGMAQINKHSFGANINGGVIYIPEARLGTDPQTGEAITNPARFPFVFGIGGSYLNSTKKWLAWRTNFNLGVTSRYDDFPESLEGEYGRSSYSYRDFFAELGFGPMFTYQKEDFGIYIGGTLDLMYFVSHKTGVTWWGEEFSQYDSFAPYPIPTPSTYIGYWQRLGNVNSPWFFEVSLMRRALGGFLNLIEYEGDYVLYTLNVGFRYELNQ